ASERGRHSRSARQQHLPLHRLRQNHRGGEVRGRAARRRGFAVSQVAPLARCAPSPLVGGGSGVGGVRLCKRGATVISPRHPPPPQPSPTRGGGGERAERSGAVNEVGAAHNIGGYVPRVDGPDKVSGRAKYTADLVAPGLLAGRIFRSPYSHAEILDVDVSAALRLPGVKAVVTGADCDKTFGVLPIARSEHPLARDKVRYRGQPVAAVAAVDDATAKRALGLIKLKVRELPAHYTSKSAMADGAITIHTHRPNNIERDVLFELGSVEQGFAEADLVREGSYDCA